MSSLELRAIAYLLFAGLIAIVGFRGGMHHVQAQWNIDKLAQAKITAKAEADLAVAIQDRARLENQVQVDHELLAKNSAAAVAAVNGSVRNLADIIQASALRAAMGDTGQFTGPAAGSGSLADLQTSIGRFTASVDGLAKACVHDSDNYAAILELAPKPVKR